MEDLWHLITLHWKDWGIPTISAVAGGVFVWFFPNRKEWREERQAKTEKRIDSKVLKALGNRELWKGPRAMTGAGIPAVRSAEIAEVLNFDEDAVADSLERLAWQGRADKDSGTLDDPRPIWLFVPVPRQNSIRGQNWPDSRTWWPFWQWLSVGT